MDAADGGKKDVLFHRETKAIVWGMQTHAVQVSRGADESKCRLLWCKFYVLRRVMMCALMTRLEYAEWVRLQLVLWHDFIGNVK